MKYKYLGRLSIEDWFCLPRKSSKNNLNIWIYLVEAFPLVGNWTMWRIGNGKNVKIGEHPWARSNIDFRLFDDLLSILHDQSIFSLWDARMQDHGRICRLG
jgi:hypothetical protein